MKKISVLLIAAAAYLAIIIPQNLSAAELSVGATTWYSWWNFNQTGTSEKREIDPTLLYGPAMSLKFSDDYNMTFVFLYGKFDMHNPDGIERIARIDSDLALNYRLTGALKIFAGAKYMSYNFEDFSHRSAGPGLGLSAVVPLSGSIYLLGNLSGLYQMGKEKSYEDKSDYYEIGGNVGLSLAYYIVPASTTISLGGRYQIFRTFYENNDEGNFPDNIHQFYGVTLAATFSFNL